MNKEDMVMWTEKYRPRTLDEVANLKEVIKGLKIFLMKPATMPHLLFSGPPGTGKTTVALCIARQLFGERWRDFTLELNASDERGIQMIRERVKSFSRYGRGGFGDIPYAIVILDECDQMTPEAQTALRRIMETSSRTCRFILICNWASKIIEPIQSRCAIFRFSALKREDLVKYLNDIAKNEGLILPEKTANAILEFSGEDLRRAINILQTSASYTKERKVDEKTVLRIVGQASPKEVQVMLNKALAGDFIEARDMLYELMSTYGLSGADIVRQIHHEILKIPNLSPDEQAELASIIGEYDFRLVEGANEDIQLSALLAQFTRFNKSRGNP
ncbi:MAG: Replication factor C small subunit [Candidatus Bathyarchaeota archaeon BA1]|nr:MAG: Replication factor C small subunit [Candidatus Bathyarchaeota archaeon BA1]